MHLENGLYAEDHVFPNPLKKFNSDDQCLTPAEKGNG